MPYSQEDKSLENGESVLRSINERRLMMKIDLRLLPMLCVMYMITFLDRWALRLVL
jgi:hypothetical protein